MKYVRQEHWEGLTGIYIEICYKTVQGKFAYHHALTDSQARFEWTPPAGVTQVYFRTMNSQYQAYVLLYLDDRPGADGFEPLWRPDDIAQFATIDAVNGCLRGRLVHAPPAFDAAKFVYEHLKPEIAPWPHLDDEDIPLKLFKLKPPVPPSPPNLPKPKA